MSHGDVLSLIMNAYGIHLVKHPPVVGADGSGVRSSHRSNRTTSAVSAQPVSAWASMCVRGLAGTRPSLHPARTNVPNLALGPPSRPAEP